MSKPVIVFVHGGQGCGKSTTTNQLREMWTHSTLFRLCGVPSNQEKANEKSYQYHRQMLGAMKGTVGTGMNFICDRSFLCDKIYANLGFKAYDFQAEAQQLSAYLDELTQDFDIYMVLLTAKEKTLEKRLNREGKPQFEQVRFDALNSLKQQEQYALEFEQLPSSVKTITIATDGRTSKQTALAISLKIKELTANRS